MHGCVDPARFDGTEIAKARCTAVTTGGDEMPLLGSRRRQCGRIWTPQASEGGFGAVVPGGPHWKRGLARNGFTTDMALEWR